MSGLLFLIVMDWIMTKTVENNNNGIRWNFTTVLEDIDFTDDLALLSSTKTHIQKKVDRLNKHSEAIGMKTSIKKTKLMRYNAKDETPVSIDGKGFISILVLFFNRSFRALRSPSVTTFYSFTSFLHSS